MNNYNSVIFSEAVAFAAEKHKNQTRKDGVTPYIYHPITVAKMVSDAGYSIKEQITAVLHDVIEDTDVEYKDILYFGKDIADAVMLLSKSDDVTKGDYIEKILQNHTAAVVKNFDRLSNLRDVKRLNNKEFAAHYYKDSEEYFYNRFSYALDCEIKGIDLGNVTNSKEFRLYKDVE